MEISAAGLRTLNSAAAAVHGATNSEATLKLGYLDHPSLISGGHVSSIPQPLVDTVPPCEMLPPRSGEATTIAESICSIREFGWPQFFHRAVLRKEIILGKMRQVLVGGKLAERAIFSGGN